MQACITAVSTLEEEEILLLSGGKGKGVKKYRQPLICAVPLLPAFQELVRDCLIHLKKTIFSSDEDWLPVFRESGR